MRHWMSNADNNLVAVVFATVVFAAFTIAMIAVIPHFAGIAFLVALYMTLTSWKWLYSDYVENATQPHIAQPGFRIALLAHVRLALASAGLFAVAGLIFCVLSGLGLSWAAVLGWLILCIFTVPMYFISGGIRVLVLNTMTGLVEAALDVAVIWYGLTVEPERLDAKHAQINDVSMRLFECLTGVRTNLSFYHEGDEIMRRMPLSRS